VGLEPVAVAARTNSEVWVSNLLSDSVSTISLSGTPHVTRTLLVGDEPRDIVFAGTPQRALSRRRIADNSAAILRSRVFRAPAIRD
jgi:YVTN family beta-propeller protein